MDDEYRPEDHINRWTKDDIFAAVYRGSPIGCDERDYPQVREWLQQCAAFWESEGQGLRSFIALNEIKRLDGAFEVREREA
jgi:hypothetical protein